jgi:triacylglycerol esterase/lipase EstA (alpha/beta hydrolase family)
MNPLELRYRKVRRVAREVASYLSFDRRGNEIVRRTDFTKCPKPVLLIHGFLATRRSFEILERRLRRDGYCVFSINLGGLFDVFNTRGIDESAQKVAQKVERLYSRFDLGPLSIIGHSKGGLIGAYYVKRLGGDRRVRALITLGSPHNGTPMAYWGYPLGLVSKSVRQMTPMSSFIKKLRVGAFPRSVRFSSIYSQEDGATPYPTALVEDDGYGHCFNIEVPGVLHREFLTKRAIYAVVRQELAASHGETIRASGILRAAAPTGEHSLSTVGERA